MFWSALSAFGMMCTIGAVFPAYYVGFLSFLTVLNEGESDMPVSLFASTLCYTVGLLLLLLMMMMMMIPLLVLFRIRMLAVALLLLVLQYAIVNAFHLYSQKQLKDT